MRILIWCTIMSYGGGTRLLANLLPAIARQDDIEFVRLVVSPQTKFKELINISHYPNIEIEYFNGHIQSAEGTLFISDCHVVYFFWPHNMDYYEINKPSICTFHDLTVFDFVPQFVSGNQIRQMWDRSRVWLEKMTFVIVPSHDVKSRLVAFFGEHCNSAVVISYAISPTDVTYNETSEDLSVQLPPDYVVYPSNTSPHKNHYNLLLAYSKFTHRKKNPLVLFGYHTDLLRCVPPDWPEVPSIATLVSLIQRIGLCHNEDFYALGYIPDSLVTPIIKNAKALIMPTLSEGGGLPVFEALKLGVPVLCSDIPVLREHLANYHDDVVWFNPESFDSILSALEYMATNYEQMKTAALNFRTDPTTTWDDLARKYIHVFRDAYRKFYSLL